MLLRRPKPSAPCVELHSVVVVSCEFMHKEVDSERLKLSKGKRAWYVEVYEGYKHGVAT